MKKNGDKIFIEKMQKDKGLFTIKFEYDGEKLLHYELKNIKRGK